MVKILNSVTRIDGVLMKRPYGPHPDPRHWDAICEDRRALQRNQCATCPASGERYRLECHHRHYDSWGKEQIEDVVILCEKCHEAITSRIRYARFAHGDQTILVVNPGQQFTPFPMVGRPEPKTYKSPSVVPELSTVTRFRPTRRKIRL